MYNPWQHPSVNDALHWHYVNRYSGTRRSRKFFAAGGWIVIQFGLVTQGVGQRLLAWGQWIEQVPWQDNRQLA